MDIKGYIDFAVAEYIKRNGPSSTPMAESVIRDIFEAYMFSPDGRKKIASSFLHPAKLRMAHMVECWNTGRGTGGQPVSKTEITGWVGEAVVAYGAFLSVIPAEEATAEPFRQLRSLLGDFKGLRDSWTKAPIAPTRP